MKKSIAMLLSIVLALSVVLCACGGEKKENLVGTWKGTVELAGMVNEEITAADETMGEYMKVESFALPMILELKEDGTCSLSVDAEGVKTVGDKLAEELAVGLEAYFVAVLAEQGLEMDIDEALALMGISMDDLIAEMKAEFTSEEMLEAFSASCKYKAEEGKLYMSEDLETEIDLTDYNTYTLQGDTLTLEAGTQSDEDFAQYLFPMVLTRAK